MGGEPHIDREFLFTIVNTLDPAYFPASLKAIEEEKREKATCEAEDVIEVKPEILELLNAFDTPMKCSKGSSRALCMLKKNSKKRKRPDCAPTELPRPPNAPSTKRSRPST